MNQDAIRTSKQTSLINAALSLMHHQGRTADVIQVPDTMPQVYVAIGDAAAIRKLLPEVQPECYGIRYVDPADGNIEWDYCWADRAMANDRINDLVQQYVDAGEKPPVFELVPLSRATNNALAAQPIEAAGSAQVAQTEHFNESGARYFGNPALPLSVNIQSLNNGTRWDATHNKGVKMFVGHDSPIGALNAALADAGAQVAQDEQEGDECGGRIVDYAARSRGYSYRVCEKCHLRYPPRSEIAVDACTARAASERAAAPAETLEQQLIEHRIGLTPENDGGFHAYVYHDSEMFEAKGYGATPSEAVAAALTQQPSAQGGDDA